MSLVYWLSKFSQEAMLVELFLIGCIGVGYFGYLLIKKRRYGAAKNNIPDNVVRAFLIELISSAEGFRRQLFGELGKGGLNISPEANAQMQAQMGAFFAQNAGIAQASGLTSAPTPEAFAAAAAAAGIGGTNNADLSALKTQLATAVQKTDELNKTIAQLNAEKANLEKAGASAGAGDSSKQLTDLNDKISKLESKLTEYEVIEDDLANLKKYQQENKQLKAQLEAMQKGAPVAAATPDIAAVVAAPVIEAVAAPTAEAAASAAPETPIEAAPAAATAAPEPSPIAVAEATVAETKATESFDTLVDKVEESLAPAPTGASASDPIVEQQAKTTQPVADAPAALDAATANAAAPLEAKPEKTDADLLNEFERMLSS